MGKFSAYHPVSKSQFRQKVDIAPLCYQPSIIASTADSLRRHN